MVVIVAVALLLLFARDLWGRKPKRSPDEQLGVAIAEYLKFIRKD